MSKMKKAFDRNSDTLPQMPNKDFPIGQIKELGLEVRI